MSYEQKLHPDQIESIDYVLKKYLSEEKAEQALKQIIDSYWPTDMDDNSGDPPESFAKYEPKDFPNRY